MLLQVQKALSMLQVLRVSFKYRIDTLVTRLETFSDIRSCAYNRLLDLIELFLYFCLHDTFLIFST